MLASLLLAAGLHLFWKGRAALLNAQDMQTKATAASAQIEQLAKASSDYAELIRRTSWKPGVQLRREALNISATFTGDELGRINEMFAVSYSGLGYFSLSNFQIEDATPQGRRAGLPFAVKVNIKGDNIFVLETQ
ncbi:MAG: hypothetical protein HQ445_05780 [Polaromonas sp.]|nr:hypothetical protein [Polaromonas sp.]